MSYSYSSLRPSEIRLLVAPRQLDFEYRAFDRTPVLKDLRFGIATFPRDNAPVYTAISYTWGSEAATKTISLDGESFHVRPNLWSCLHYLSQSGWQYLWVDAICINQADNSEKAEQVRMMDDIYRGAAVVSVWLGLLPFELPGGSVWPEQVFTVDIDSFDWDAEFQHLANRPYWGRIWVIQEVLVATDVHIHCSGRCIGWDLFTEMLQRKIGKFSVDAELVDKLSLSTAGQKYRALPLLLGRNVDKHPKLRQPLYDMLLNHGRAECGDPRDRVFALLSLVTSDERAILSKFFPDYSLSHDDVVLITLSYFLELDERSLSRTRITEDSRTLFRALGVVSRKRARRLLWAAERFSSNWEKSTVKNRGPYNVCYPFELLEGPEGEELIDTEDEADLEEVFDGSSDTVADDIEPFNSTSRPRASWFGWLMRNAVAIALLMVIGSSVNYWVTGRWRWMI